MHDIMKIICILQPLSLPHTIYHTLSHIEQQVRYLLICYLLSDGICKQVNIWISKTISRAYLMCMWCAMRIQLFAPCFVSYYVFIFTILRFEIRNWIEPKVPIIYRVDIINQGLLVLHICHMHVHVYCNTAYT